MFKQCRQYWDFNSKIRRSLEPNDVSEYFTFGTAIHAGLEEWYNPQWLPNGHPSIESVKDSNAIYEFLRSWLEHGDDRLTVMTWEEYNSLGIEMLTGYFEYARVNDNFMPVRTEIEFEVPIPVGASLWHKVFNRKNFGFDANDCLTHNGRPVVYQGRLDLLARDEHGLVIVDHKTASKFDSTAHLEMGEQVASYAWAMRSCGYEVHSIIYNELKKATPEEPEVLKSGKLSKNKAVATSVAKFRQALARTGQSEVGYEDYLAWLEINPPQLFRRTTVRKSSKELDVIGERILLEALDMLDDPSIYPTPSKNYNCVKCAFRQPCLAANDGSNVEAILARGYKPHA